ncbi:MAG: hypothetical protein QXF12_07365 [Candidatus Aenigmatarchaeota archaeon]
METKTLTNMKANVSSRRSIESITKMQSRMLLKNYGVSIVTNSKVTETIKLLSSKFKNDLPAGYYVSVAIGYDKRSKMYLALASVYHIAKRYMVAHFPLDSNRDLDELLNRLISSADSFYAYVPSF